MEHLNLAFKHPKHSMGLPLCRSIGVVLGINVGIYGSPMECLGKVLLVSIDGSWMMVDVCGGWAGEAIVVSLES